jgi:Fe-S-cluster containining protein
MGGIHVMATAFGLEKIRRKDVPEGHVLCEYCIAKCCRYFALPIDTPETFEDYEYIRWYLLHDRATVFKEDEDWYLIVHTVCEHLQPDNRCGIYETRPPICREYKIKNCEYEDDWTYEFYLETADQVTEYREAVVQKRGRSIRSPKPPLLPIMA